MTKTTSKAEKSPKNLSAMAQLLNKVSFKRLKLTRGEMVEGVVVSITPDEVILDLGTKSEGVINRKDLSAEQLTNLKVGGKLQAFVYLPENQSGQVVLTLFEQSLKGNWQNSDKARFWQKFIRAMEQKSRLNGLVTDLNKAGLVVDIEGIKGFLPVSQLSLDKVPSEGLSGMLGKDITVSVLEVNPTNNRLILSSRRQFSEKERENLRKFKAGEVKKFKVLVVTPIGLLGTISDENTLTDGYIANFEVAWEKVDELSSRYKSGDEIEAKVLGVDDQLGRINLSIKQLETDPWEKGVSGIQVDDVISGQVAELTQEGVKVTLNNAEGFVPAENIEPGMGIKFEIGQTANFLVSGLDKRRRVIVLAPFITSTKGLIYK